MAVAVERGLDDASVRLTTEGQAAAHVVTFVDRDALTARVVTFMDGDAPAAAW